MLHPGDDEIRGALTLAIAALGHAPSLDELAAAVGRRADDVAASLQRLHDAHALLLHPNSPRPWVVHPFALTAGGCWVRTPRRGYWANCLYCAFGVAAALRSDAVITTRLGGEEETIQIDLVDGAPLPEDVVFHLSIPPARWWDNVIASCASFQPFRREADVDAWCEAHAMPRGAILSLPQLWGFAREWYGDYLHAPWRKRDAVEARELFARHGLTGPFWALS